MMSRKIKNRIANIFGRFHITSLLNIINNKYGGFILSYHTPMPEIVNIHLNKLEKLQAISLNEMIDRLEKGHSTKGCYTVTVDDGVASTTNSLSKIAIDRNIPITFFLPTSFIDSGKAYWFYRLAGLFENINFGMIKYKNTDYNLKNVQLKTKLSNMIFLDYLKLHFTVAESKTDKFIEECVANDIIQSHVRLGPHPISWEEVSQLATNRLISFESHTVNHPNLSVLTDKEIEYEIIESMKRIEHFTKKNVNISVILLEIRIQLD